MSKRKPKTPEEKTHENKIYRQMAYEALKRGADKWRAKKGVKRRDYFAS